MKIYHALLMLFIAAMLPACGDNGPLSAMMGKDDYTFSLPAQWEETQKGNLQLLFNSLMADSLVNEHMLANIRRTEGLPPTFLVIGSNRGGPYSRDAVERQYDEYLRRPVKNEPLKVVGSMDLDAGTMLVESHHEQVVFIMRRLYTNKGYIQMTAMCRLDEPETTAEVRAIMDSLAPAPELAYK